MNASESALSRLALAAAARGLRTIVPGQALSLAVARSGELVVERGTAWVTFDVPARGRPGAPLGDLVLAAGARLPLACGQRLVIEPIARTGETPQAISRRPNVQGVVVTLAEHVRTETVIDAATGQARAAVLLRFLTE